ncbi:hypothetical protein GXW82_04180 [Streptacidiphilus sp. 4-A2]|nr:hypothetical protein [Streptacidiphilus sp. 4-A2]
MTAAAWSPIPGRRRLLQGERARVGTDRGGPLVARSRLRSAATRALAAARRWPRQARVTARCPSRNAWRCGRLPQPGLHRLLGEPVGLGVVAQRMCLDAEAAHPRA